MPESEASLLQLEHGNTSLKTGFGTDEAAQGTLGRLGTGLQGSNVLTQIRQLGPVVLDLPADAPVALSMGQRRCHERLFLRLTDRCGTATAPPDAIGILRCAVVAQALIPTGEPEAQVRRDTIFGAGLAMLRNVVGPFAALSVLEANAVPVTLQALILRKRGTGGDRQKQPQDRKNIHFSHAPQQTGFRAKGQ